MLEASVLRYLRPAVAAAALADADRYRDSALGKAADIVKQAQQEADELRAEAQQILDEARRMAAAMTAGRPDTGGPTTDEHPPSRTAGFPASSGSAMRAVVPTRAAGSWTLKTLLYDVGGLGSDPSLVTVAGTGRLHSDLQLLTLLASGWSEPLSGHRPIRLQVPFTYQLPVPLWLTCHGDIGEAGADLLSTEDHPAAAVVLWQCKSAALPDVLRDQCHPLLRTSDRLWAERLLPDGREVLAAALLGECHGAEFERVAHLVWMRCGDRPDRRQPGRSGGSWSAWWSTLMTTRADHGWVRRAPELFESAATSPRVGGPLPILSPVRRLLLACDVEGFGRADAGLRSRWQHAVRQVLGDAASQVGLDSSRWQRHAAGDGELAILPVGTSWRVVFDQLLGAVDRQLHEYNRYATDAARLRLRVAVHEGVAAYTADGVAGQAATAVTRMVDAPPLKQALNAHPKASMAVAVSDPVYQDVKHGRDRYMRITIPQATKGSPEAAAWVFVPDGNMRFPDWTAPASETANDRWPGQTPRQRPQDEVQLTT
ncbi:hypothetical protein [Dactylosporangium sp. NPDC048998]|uniref:hypothetical protein n=1 Tax=Dactylosporangium sp. NPDC048998 TaxID=3363976 RepID=UPI0037175A26